MSLRFYISQFKTISLLDAMQHTQMKKQCFLCAIQTASSRTVASPETARTSPSHCLANWPRILCRTTTASARGGTPGASTSKWEPQVGGNSGLSNHSFHAMVLYNLFIIRTVFMSVKRGLPFTRIECVLFIYLYIFVCHLFNDDFSLAQTR